MVVPNNNGVFLLEMINYGGVLGGTIILGKPLCGGDFFLHMLDFGALRLDHIFDSKS